MREYSLSVGIVTYRSGREVLGRLLESLAAAVRRAGAEAALKVAVQVVCNDEEQARVAAVSALVKELADNAPSGLHCELVAGQGNVGYGAAQNLAIRRSSADFHLVLNPDVELDADALIESVRFLDAESGCGARRAPRHWTVRAATPALQSARRRCWCSC